MKAARRRAAPNYRPGISEMLPAAGHKGARPLQKGFRQEINEAENVHRVLIGLHKSPLKGRTREDAAPVPESTAAEQRKTWSNRRLFFNWWRYDEGRAAAGGGRRWSPPPLLQVQAA